MRVLIVDDEPMIAIAAADALQDAGYQTVDLAGSLDKAQTLIAANRYDAAILDANLAGVSAAPLAVLLRDKAVPFLVLSGYSSKQLADIFPGVPVLSKPYDADDLVAQVNKLASAS